MNNPIRKAWEREMELLKKIFGSVPSEAEEDGPMEWDEAMEKPMVVPVKLDKGGKMEIKINHDRRPILGGQKVF